MTELFDIRMSTHSDKYHPRCGAEHSHKPLKAIIGIAFLVVLSFLLYEINGKSPEQQSARAPIAHHIFAWNAR